MTVLLTLLAVGEVLTLGALAFLHRQNGHLQAHIWEVDEYAGNVMHDLEIVHEEVHAVGGGLDSVIDYLQPDGGECMYCSLQIPHPGDPVQEG